MKHFLKIFDKITPKPITFSLEGEWWTDDWGPVGSGSKLGRVWDTSIGREGLFGALGDWLGLWDSGTTKRHKIKQINTIAKYKNDLRDRQTEFTDYAMGTNLMDQKVSGEKTTGLINNMLNTGNLSKDTTRSFGVNKIINDSVIARNNTFKKTLNDIRDRENVMDDKLFEATRAQQTIRDA